MPREKQHENYLPRLRRLNYLRPGMPLHDRLRRAPQTLIFSVKLKGRVAPPYGLRTKSPQWGRQPVETVLWWRDLGRVTYMQARQATAKYLDEIYRILQRQQPIVGLRVTLIDWNKGEPVSRSVLLDPWFYKHSFHGRPLDVFQLKAWGMDSNYAIRTRSFVSYQAAKQEENPNANLSAVMGRRLDLAIDQAITTIITKTLPNWMRARSVMQVSPDKRLLMLQIRKAMNALRSRSTIDRLKAHLASEFENDPDFARKVRGATSRNSVKEAAVAWLKKEVAERYLRS